MKNIYILSFQIYRTILFLLLPIFLFGLFMVGTAGHNPSLKFSDYCFFGFILLTPIVLTVFKKLDNKETVIGKILNIIVILLVILGIIISIFGILDQVKLYINNNFTSGDIITTIIILSLIILSTILLIGLIKNKV